MIKKFFGTTIIALVTMPTLFAQDSTKPFTVSGYVDAYFRTGITGNASGSETFNNFTSFTGSNNTFQLGMASIKAQYATSKAGVVVDLGFGKRAEEFSYADEGTLQAIKQAYVYYAPSEDIKFTFGKFGTHVGYELLDPQLNKNYSMSYMFTNGPFSHTGVKADVALGKGFGLMVGVANPIDVTAPSSGSDPKTFIAQLSSVGSKHAVYLNYAGYSGGHEYNVNASSLSQIGLTATVTFSDKFSLGYDGTVQWVKDEDYQGTKTTQTKNWWGSALYANLTTSSVFGLTLRAEYFADQKYKMKAPGTDIFATTLSGNFKVGGFIFIPELRLENAKDEVFGKLGTTVADDASKSALSAIFAAIYTF